MLGSHHFKYFPQINTLFSLCCFVSDISGSVCTLLRGTHCLSHTTSMAFQWQQASWWPLYIEIEELYLHKVTGRRLLLMSYKAQINYQWFLLECLELQVFLQEWNAPCILAWHWNPEVWLLKQGQGGERKVRQDRAFWQEGYVQEESSDNGYFEGRAALPRWQEGCVEERVEVQIRDTLLVTV